MCIPTIVRYTGQAHCHSATCILWNSKCKQISRFQSHLSFETFRYGMESIVFQNWSRVWRWFDTISLVPVGAEILLILTWYHAVIRQSHSLFSCISSNHTVIHLNHIAVWMWMKIQRSKVMTRMETKEICLSNHTAILR